MGKKEHSIHYEFPVDAKPKLLQSIICAVEYSPVKPITVIARQHSDKDYFGRCFREADTIVINLDTIEKNHKKRKKSGIRHDLSMMVLQTTFHELCHLRPKNKGKLRKKQEDHADKWARKQAKKTTGDCLLDF